MQRQMTEGELDNFYHIIGKAIWHLQYVEESLGYLYLYKEIFVDLNSVTEEKAEIELKKVHKKTLGQLVHEIEKKSLMLPSSIDRLKDFNDDRKWVVHHSLIKDGDNLYNENGRNAVFNRIASFIKEAIILQKLVGEEIATYCESKGLSRAWQESKANEELNKLKGLV